MPYYDDRMPPHCATCTCHLPPEEPETHYCSKCGVSMYSRSAVKRGTCDRCDELTYHCDICGEHLGEPRDDDRICDTCAALSRLRGGK